MCYCEHIQHRPTSFYKIVKCFTFKMSVYETCKSMHFVIYIFLTESLCWNWGCNTIKKNDFSQVHPKYNKPKQNNVHPFYTWAQSLKISGFFALSNWLKWPGSIEGVARRRVDWILHNTEERSSHWYLSYHTGPSFVNIKEIIPSHNPLWQQHLEWCSHTN